MTIVTDNFPDALLDRIELAGAEERAMGRLGNRHIRLRERDAGPAYMKIGAGLAGKDLLEEADRLEWIGDRLPVPQILYCQTCGDRVYLLSSELPGLPLYKCIEELSVAKAVEKFAQGLKMIHALPTKDCPFDRVLETELAESERRLQDGDLNIEAFIADTSAEPTDVLDELHARALRAEEIVFTHGDYCFPNVLVTGDLITGIVDWGIAGISDWHRDFMSAELTIRRNCGEEWIPAFYEAYGSPEIDRERIHYFWLLDRFFSHFEGLPPVGRPASASHP